MGFRSMFGVPSLPLSRPPGGWWVGGGREGLPNIDRTHIEVKFNSNPAKLSEAKLADQVKVNTIQVKLIRKQSSVKVNVT